MGLCLDCPRNWTHDPTDRSVRARCCRDAFNLDAERQLASVAVQAGEHAMVLTNRHARRAAAARARRDR